MAMFHIGGGGVNPLHSVEEAKKPIKETVVFLSSIIIAIFLISTSIQSIGPKTLVIGEREDQPQVFNRIRLIGMNFNRTSIAGSGNFFGVDFMIYGQPKNDFLRVSVGEYYDFGTWYTNNTIRTQYNGEEMLLQAEGWKEADNAEFTVMALIDVKGFVPEPDYPSDVTFLEMNYSRGKYSYVERENALCSFDETVSLFWINWTMMPWNRYTIGYYATVYDDDFQLEVVPHEDERYTQVPEEVTQKINVRARYATDGAETDLEKIYALMDYLQTGYEYDYMWRDAPYDTDPVLWFLFTEHKGISIHFNTALVLMARTLGIPSRVVGGYPLGSGKIQFIAPWDRRVYAEFWFKGIGWVRFDATPDPVYEQIEVGSTTIRTRGRKKSVESQFDNQNEDNRTQIIMIIVAVVIGFAFIAFIIDSILESRRKKQEYEETILAEYLKELDSRLGIRFKEIEPPLPNVWGLNNPITIIIASSLKGQLKISIDSEETTYSDFEDSIQVRKSFEKGGHTIRATLRTEKTQTRIKSLIGLRAVDYREEIVQLFNKVLKDPELAANWWRLTVGEIQSKLRDNYPELSTEALGRFTSLFEVADYSLHMMSREVYVRFYLAKKELEEYIEGGETE